MLIRTTITRITCCPGYFEVNNGSYNKGDRDA